MKESCQKIKDYLMKTKIGKFAIENPWFFISIVLTGIFVISPLWLRCSWLRGIFSSFLYSLKEQGYKSSYVETLGAILGTFLAITGALWTQRRFEQEMQLKEEEKEAKIEAENRRERFLIIYYDFRFVFDDIKNNMFFFLYEKTGTTENSLTDENILIFREKFKKFKVHIHNDWIVNVASVSKYLPTEEVKKIYEIYGHLQELDQIFNKPIDEISDSELKIAYSKMYHYMSPTRAVENPMRIIKVDLKDSIISLLDKLQKVGEF